MPELIIKSIPSCAEVRIDGEYIGTTPIIHPIGETTDLTMFRSKYLSNECVSCSWDVLKPKLEDLTVSRLWWDLTRDERYSIAEMAIKSTLFYHIHYDRGGKPNCEGGEGEWKIALCVNNTIIRCLKFSGLPDTVPYWSPNADECYYERDIDRGEYCYVSDSPYRLPCHFVSRIGGARANHAMAAIQIENNYDSLNNWIVFQYDSFDIKPGNSQMPRGSMVMIYKSDGFQCGVSYGTKLAEFYV